MSILRAIIVDDEPLARDLLEAVLQNCEGVSIVARCRNGFEAIAAVQTHQPDIAFLDIEMPGPSGFDIIKSIQADILPHIIFTTAYAEYAVKAFRVNAVDYLLKPIDETAVKEALLRIKPKSNGQAKPELLKALIDPAARPNTLLIRDNDRQYFISPDQIDWLEAAGDYVCIHLRDEQGRKTTRIARRTLTAMEKQLGQALFLRVHRSTIVRLDRVTAVKAGNKGDGMVELAGGTALKVSRANMPKLKSALAGL